MTLRDPVSMQRLGAEFVRLDENPAELCAGGCGQPRPLIGSGSFVYRPAYCASCEPSQRERASREKLEHDVAEAKRLRSALREQLAETFGSAYRGFTFATYPADREGLRVCAEAERWVQGFVDGDRRNLLLYGPAGAGKTGLAHAISLALIEHGFRVRAVAWAHLLARLRSTVSRGSDVTAELSPFRVAPVLVIDDFGTREDPSGWVVEMAELLIDHRHRNELPTIMTSNYPPSELAARFGHGDQVAGDRIASRLCQGAQQVRFAAGDRRLGGGAAVAVVVPIEQGRRS